MVENGTRTSFIDTLHRAATHGHGRFRLAALAGSVKPVNPPELTGLIAAAAMCGFLDFISLPLPFSTNRKLCHLLCEITFTKDVAGCSVIKMQQSFPQ